jgi:hypothetical protein
MGEDFINKVNKYLKIAHNRIEYKSYDVMFLGYHPASIKYIYSSVNHNTNKINDNDNDNDIFVNAAKVYGLFGYIVTKKGAEKLLNIFPITEQIDTELYKSFHKFGVKAILLRPDLRIITSEPSEFAKTFGSDIQTRSIYNSNNDPTIFLNTAKCMEGFPSDSIIFDIIHVIIIIIISFVIIIFLKNNSWT